MTLAIPRVSTSLIRAARVDAVEAAARWADTPVIDVFRGAFPAEAHAALDGFRQHVRGMGPSQWEAFAAGGAVSRWSANTDAQNLALLARGERSVALFDDGPLCGRFTSFVAHTEEKARIVEELGFVATRYRMEFNGRMNYNVAAAPDAATGVAIMRVNEAAPDIDRDIAFGMLLGYEPRDIAFFAHRNGGYEGVRHLTGLP